MKVAINNEKWQKNNGIIKKSKKGGGCG